MSFEELELSPKIIKALNELNYEKASPIQKQAIPLINAGHDLIACAQTGTGKTAAFTLPLIQRILEENSKWRTTTVLILSPTRELAAQIVEQVNAYSKYLPVRCAPVYGGVSMTKQIQSLRKGVQILVATPGRLLDHFRQKTICMDDLKTLVLDEADRMLDMGFIKDIRKICQYLPKGDRQTLLFSATFSDEIKSLSEEFLNRPKLVKVAKENTPVKVIDQIVYNVDKERRRRLLTHLLQKEAWTQVLVFTRTKHGANRLAEQLNFDGFDAHAFHSNKSQGARLKTLDLFKQGKIKALVATDIAARGIDIDDLPFVVNYDLPELPENYVHRIGRTGRAGKVGKAASFVSIDDGHLLRQIEKLIKKDIPKKIVPGFEPNPGIKPSKEAIKKSWVLKKKFRKKR